jgi:hypothetical protein
MAIRRGFVIITCHCPYRAYVVCPGWGQSGLRQAFDGDAVAAPELQQSFVAEQPRGSQDGVAVHPEHGGQVACGRQPLAG